MNAFCQANGTSLSCRVINNRIPTLEELGFPEIVSWLALRPHGLILITGPTGSGKSTTLAAMINLINSQKSCHIIALEDPIEYIHKNKKSLISQRQIGRDSQSFPNALRAALRQDPDVIMVGEMRDLETMSVAITAAETGHLVLATLHTIDAPQSLARIVDVFPPNQQLQVRIQLSNSLMGVVSQRLMPRKDSAGRIASLEILVSTPAVRNLIREGKLHQIYSAMQTGAKFGMQTMDSYIENLHQKGLIEAKQTDEYRQSRE